MSGRFKQINEHYIEDIFNNKKYNLSEACMLLNSYDKDLTSDDITYPVLRDWFGQLEHAFEVYLDEETDRDKRVVLSHVIVKIKSIKEDLRSIL